MKKAVIGSKVALCTFDVAKECQSVTEMGDTFSILQLSEEQKTPAPNHTSLRQSEGTM